MTLTSELSSDEEWGDFPVHFWNHDRRFEAFETIDLKSDLFSSQKIDFLQNYASIFFLSLGRNSEFR